MTHREQNGELPPIDRLDLATDALRTTSIPAGPAPDLMAATIAALQAQSQLQTTDIVRFQERRKLMFRIARYSGVTSAMILLLCVLGWFLTDHSSAMAFADVLRKIQNADSVTLQQRQKIGQQPEITVKVLMQGAAVRLEFAETQVAVYDLSKKRGVDATPFQKRIDIHRFDLTDNQVKHIPNLLEALQTSKEKSAERLGEEIIAGRKQEIFRLEKFHPLIGAGDAKLKLWSDAETGLPSKIEARWKDQPDGPESYVIMESFKWNGKLDPSLFDLDKPNVECLKPALSRVIPVNRPKHVLPVGAHEVSLSGQVVDPKGQAQAGVKVYASGFEITKDWTSSPVVLATTDAQGRFSASLKLMYPEAIEGVVLSATHEPNGLAGIQLNTVEKLNEITLRLIPAGTPIQGRVIDAAGKAVSDVTVQAISLTELPRTLGLVQTAQKSPEYVKAHVKLIAPVKADAEGRFTLAGLGQDRIATLEIEGKGIARAQVQVATAVEAKSDKILGPVFEYQAKPGRTIQGRVIDAETKAPLKDVQITILEATGLFFTDADGKFEFSGAPILEKYGVIALPARRQPYLIGSQSVASTANAQSVTVELQLHQGILFSGRIVDDETGLSVRTQIGYFPLYPNPNLKADMGYGAAGGGGATSEAHTFWGDSFSIVILPGPGALGIRALAENRYENVRVNPFDFFKQGEYGGDQPPQLSRSNLLWKQELAPRSASGLLQDQYNSIILLNPKAGQGPIEQIIRLKPRKLTAAK
jgi:hypothetical protein